MKDQRATRREVLKGTALTLAAGALAARAQVAVSDMAGMDAERVSVVLLDRQFGLSGSQLRLARQGARIVHLEADPVRMWRGALAPLLAARSTRLLGRTTWPQFLMVRGLAEESGRRVRHQQLDAADGAITWLIA